MFEVVSKYQDSNIQIPVRKTVAAAGYDFAAAEDIIIPPYVQHLASMNSDGSLKTLDELAQITKDTDARPTLIPTGIKCRLPATCYLQLSIRSSSPLKYWLTLANGTGIIDADYCDNLDNEGEIFFQVINWSPFPIQIKAGDIIGQGIIAPYYIFTEESKEGQTDRTGGFGSTTNG